jgi:FG-GAP-like repeat
MSTHKRAGNRASNATASSDLLSIIETNPSGPENVARQDRQRFVFKRSHSLALGGLIVILLLGVGIMASNGWLPSTDPLSGKRTGWFGKELAKNAPSSWNPLVDPTPAPTPQLSKENIYAGSRLLAVVDANAQENPPVDLAVWRPGVNSTWYVMGPGATIAASASWGVSTDTPKPGDFDGDGKTDFCVFRATNSTWYIIYSSTGATAGIAFGAAYDVPVIADFDGDGKSDLAVFRPSTGIWYWLKSSEGNAVQYTSFGVSTDIPAAADYDGDGKADITVWRPGDHTFYTLRSSDISYQTAYFPGASGDPMPADYNGDGKANYALYNDSNWIIMDAGGTVATTSFGTSGDRAVPNDYDGDGICDLAVWRNSNADWYIRPSTNTSTFRQDHWGASGDTPVPAFYRR